METTNFVGGNTGPWKVTELRPVVGEPLPHVPFVDVRSSYPITTVSGLWTMRGVRSNMRYTEKSEHEKLMTVQASLGRKEATLAALIPIKKTAEWWLLAQDERRRIFEDQSHHIGIGLDYLPTIARRLYHSRDLGEPFDFITWFEYAPQHAAQFEELLTTLRASPEWNYVEREADIRLIRL